MVGFTRATFAVLAVLVLTACGSREEILEGDREDLREVVGRIGGVAGSGPEALPIRLEAPQVNAAWTHVSGGPDHAIAHPALPGPLTEVWSVSVGEGTARRLRVPTAPVVADGRIFTLDSAGRVAATSTAGAALWSRPLAPASDSGETLFGGGLAVAGATLYVATGFGDLVALDAATGTPRWTQSFVAPVGGAPTVSGGVVYTVTRDGQAYAIDAGTGRIRWQIPGTPSTAGVDGGAAPAVDGRIAVFPYPSGELVAVLKNSGLRIWAAPISGQRAGRVYARFGDITGDPVITNGRVIASTPSGRTAAVDALSGDRLWTAREGALGPVWVAGGSVFLMSDQNAVVRLDAETGALIWRTQLPLYTDPRLRRRQAIFAHYGPVLAGGRLIVASDDGLMRLLDPATGAITETRPLPGGGAATPPVVAGGTLYLVTTDGTLRAFR